MEGSAAAAAAKTIASAFLREAEYLNGVGDEVRDLQGHLECMQQFLQHVDANPSLLKQDGQLRILTLEMRELAFRAEDVIDTYIVDIRYKIQNENFFLKLVSFTSHSYQIHMLRNEIKDIQQKIKDAISRSENFRASISTTSQSQGAFVGSSYSEAVAENYIHIDDEFVVGIEDDIIGLVKRLTDRNDDFQVLAIVGPMGAGKTTLASQIYRHTKVQSSFPHRTFVSISQKWSRLDLLHHISKEVLGKSDNLSEWELVRELHYFMKDKRCLVVLDDIWKKEAWDDIYPIFPRTQGLRVILTTRNEEVPQYVDSRCVIHMPQKLTDAQMWTLFSKGAVEGRHGIENNVEFEMLGKLMLQKCHRLPLAVVTLVGILRTKQHLYEWEQVSVALRGKILEEKGGYTYGVVEERLELSYLDLPAHLKPLFLYLAIIPEGQVWSSNQLIDMWIAEGFVADDQIGRFKTLEDKGMHYMSELAQRYVIQVKKRNHRDQVEYLNFHFLMRELCIKKATESQFLENISSTCSYGTRTNKPRRISIFSRGYRLEENKFLKTILYQGLSYKSNDEVFKELESIHKDFKLLRVLRISNCANKTLPKQIGNLIHLTYLSVTRTQITELPESVKKLRNLIYLEFNPAFVGGRTAKVPDDLVGSMENLRVLELPDKLLKGGSNNCKKLGLNSERHKKLHTFKCGAGRWMTKDLHVNDLPTLKDLRIRNIDETEEMEVIHQCMDFLEGSLQTFRCEFNGVSKELKFDTEKLMGSQTIHTLYLDGRLVSNLTIQFPANLVSLVISKSEIGEEVDLMRILGQLSKLKELYIARQAYLGSVLYCRGTSFPQLEELMLSSLDSLEEWIVEEGVMNRLKKVTIDDCPRLIRLPQGIRSITTLKELEITSMPEEFCWRLGLKRDQDGGPASSVHTQGGEDSYIIEHIPSVKLDHIKVTSTGVSGGDTLSNQTEHPIAHIPEVSIDEKVIQSLYEPTKQVQTSNEHDPETESCSDSNVGESIAAIKETTLKSGVSGGDSLSHQTERQSPISPDEVTQLTSPTPTEIVPMWNEYQHTPHVVPAPEHHGPVLRVGSENQGTAHCPAEEFYFDSHIDDGTAHCPAEEFYFDSHIDDGTAHYPPEESSSDSDVDDSIVAFKETTLKSGVSGGDSLSNQTEHLNADIPEVYIDEKVIQSLYEPTKQVQTGNEHDPDTESCSDSNVGESIAAFKETTLKPSVSGGDSRSNQTEHINDKFIQIFYEPTKQVKKWWNKGWSSIFGQETGNEHDPETESCSDSNVGESTTAFKETTLKSGVFGGDSRSNQTEPTPEHTPHAVPAPEHHGPALPVGFENQGTYDNNNGINKEEAKGMLFLFGEGYEFEKQVMIQLWMALGLLADEPMEENGAYYFENLVSEGYILCSVPNYLYRVNLEKLGTEVNIEKQSCIKLDNTRRNVDFSTETLHASVVCDEINASIFQTLRGFSRLRTLLFLGSYGSKLQQVPRDLFLCYESLEALDLSGTHIKELPSSAGKMINLRYLDLSWTFLEALPERIDRFKKLQTLKLEGCSRLRMLPDEMKGLTDLRHLHLDVLSELSAFPRGIGALVNIRTLSAFPVGTEQGLEISELKYLNHITGSFCIANIENVQSADVAKEAFLNEKKKIKKLNLRWSDHNIECHMNEVEGILQNLCPFLNLEEIEIVWYPGNKLPDWIADVSFEKLVSITLFGCAKVNMLPSMENLHALESLELVSLNSLTKLDFKGVAAEYVAFPKLKKLSVDEMLNLETWAEAGEGDYPCIEELSIKDCPKLSEFPSIVYAPSLKHLEASGCESVVLESDKTLPELLEQLRIEDCPLMEDRCSKDGGQDWHKIQHVPTIWVNHFPIQPIEYMEY